MRHGRGWATAGFLLGIGASVAGNIAHARPELGAQIAAAFYPVALLVTVEVLARVEWPAGGAWFGVRWVGAGTVSLVAAVVSYLHLHGLLISYGEETVTALIGPLSVDGLMVVSGFALLAIGQTASATETVEAPGEVAAFVEAPEKAEAVPEPTPEPVKARKPPVRKPTPRPVENPKSSSGVDPNLEPLIEQARAEFAGRLAEGDIPPVKTLKTALRVGHPKAKAVHQALAA